MQDIYEPGNDQVNLDAVLMPFPEFKPLDSVIVDGISEDGDSTFSGQTGTVVCTELIVGQGNFYVVDVASQIVRGIALDMLRAAA